MVIGGAAAHTTVETTEIYTHARGADALISPLDLPPVLQIGNLVPFSHHIRTA